MHNKKLQSIPEMMVSKRFYLILTAFILTTVIGMAQDFKLYMSTKAMEIPTAQRISSPELIRDWIEVSDGGIYSNRLEVDNFIQMMKSNKMKGREEAEQFRQMRDRTILAFRIDDGGKKKAYNITAKLGSKSKKFSSSGYFFLNLPMSEDYVNLTVSQVGDASNKLSIKCQSKPFGNDSIYLFQLDRVCQEVPEIFNLEILMSDSTYENFPITNQKFQCLFTTPVRYPIKAFLGMPDKKLELNTQNWMPGVGLSETFNNLIIRKDGNFDQHSAEFATFNWIGAGLFAKYDTLFIQARSTTGTLIENATVNIQSIDNDMKPVDNPDVRYLGYNKPTHEYMIVTKGNPAYIEFIADGFLPLLYHYKGAADPVTHVLSMTGISDNITMTPGKVDMNSLAFFKKELRFVQKKDNYLNSAKKIWDANTVSMDLVNRPATETVYFSPNGATEELKMVNGQLLDKYATLDLSYSVPKGSAIKENGQLQIDFKNNTATCFAPFIGNEVVDAQVYKGLQHSYVKSSYDLSDCIPKGETAAFTLRNGDVVDTSYPLLCNFSFTEKEIKESGELESELPTKKAEDEKPQDQLEKDMELKVPFNINFKVSDKCKISLSAKLDYVKGEISWKLVVKINESDPSIKPVMDDAKENNNIINSYKNFKSGDKTYNFNSGVVDSDKDVNDIFGQTVSSSAGTKISFFASGKIPFTGYIDHPKTNFFDFVEELGGTYGYGITYGMTTLGSLMREKNFPEVLINAADYIDDYIRFGFKLDCYVGGGIGLTTFNDAYADQLCGRGAYAEFLAYVILAAWLEMGFPPNPMFNFEGGIRGGGKLGFSTKLVTSLDLQGGFGVKLTYRALMQFYMFLDSFLGGFHKSADIFNLGESKLIPETDFNPYHKNFPYWLPKGGKTRANSYAPLRTAVDSDFGNIVYEDVARDVAPHYINENAIVINHLHDSQVYDDDAIDVVSIPNKETTKLSDAEHLAVNHQMSSDGDQKMVVFEQCSEKVNPESVTDNNLNQRSIELSQAFNVRASILQPDNTWTTHKVYESNEANLRPVGAIQKDGHAAVVWMKGMYNGIGEETEYAMDKNSMLIGDLVYSRFDGNSWSAPISLMQLNEDRSTNNYQVIMRKDSILIATLQTDHPNTDRQTTKIMYISVAPDGKQQFTDEPIDAYGFSLAKVGDYNLIGITHEADTSKADIYMKTLRMDGSNEGTVGTDVGLQDHSPVGAKIIPSPNAYNINDFALMWIENTSTGNNEDGERTYLNGYRRVLNAARVNLLGDLHATTPIMLGADKDNLMLLAFDGYFDDDRVKAVYTLSDPSISGGTVIVESEKIFGNSFTYDLIYDDTHVTDNVYIPLKLTINNTGTSAIHAVKLTLNEQQIEITDAFVAPFQSRDFIVSYPMDETFNGYISSQVTVMYENIFKSNVSRRLKKSLLAGSKSKSLLVNNINTELRVISQNVDDKGNNTFVVEVINHSKIKFRENQSIVVGIFDNPRFTRDLVNKSAVILPTSEFIDYGLFQKAVTTITAPNVTNDSEAYLMATIYDQRFGTSEESIIYEEENRENSYQTVRLLSKGTPTIVDGIRQDLRAERQMKGQRISFTYKSNGILVSGLHSRETVRLHDIYGREIYVGKAKGGQHLVPIERHAFYVVTAGDESLKFLF